MTALHEAAQQALDDLRDLHANHNITYAGTIWRLVVALADPVQEQEPLGWAVQVGTHSAGRRQGKPRYVLFFNKSDAEHLADRTRGARPEPFYLGEQR